MLRLLDITSPPLPVPTILFFAGLVLFVIFSLMARLGVRRYGDSPLEHSGLSSAQRVDITRSIVQRRQPTESDLQELAMNWARFEVAAGRWNAVQSCLGSLSIILILCVAYDFPGFTPVVVVVAVLQAVLVLFSVVVVTATARRLPACAELVRNGGFETAPTAISDTEPRP